LIDDFTFCNVIGPNPNIFNIGCSLNIFYPSVNISPTFNITSTDVLATGDTLVITVDGITVSFINITRLTFIIFDGISSQATCLINNNESASSPTSAVYNIPTIGNSKSSNANISLSGLTFLSPPDSKISSPINISFFRAGGIYMTGKISITATPGSLTSLVLSADTYIINAFSTYTI
jgi:hypothetical protein